MTAPFVPPQRPQPIAGVRTTAEAPNKAKDVQDVSPPSVAKFLAWFRSAGLQKTNRFFVDIAFPRSLMLYSGYDGQKREDTLLACEEMSIPQRQVQTRTLRLGGLDERRANTMDYGGEFSLTFLVDSTHEIQFLFEKWLNIEVDQFSREVGEYSEYATTVDLWFLRPFSMNETYAPLARTNSPSGFLRQTKERVLNLAAAEVGKLKTKALQSIETAKQTALGKNLNTYNRIKGVLPLELLYQQEQPVSDFAMYKISFKEAFPVSINRSVLNQGGTEVFRITVQFAFKEYETSASDPQPVDKKFTDVFNFLKRAGIPTSASGLARTAINLL